MRLCDRRPAYLVITENIEMRLFSSEEVCEMVTTQEKKEENAFEQRYRYLEHPLAPYPEEDENQLDEIKPKQQQKNKTKPSVCEETLCCSHIFDLVEDADIEMESFPPIRLSDIELVEMKSSDSASDTLSSPNKTRHVKWKKLNPQKIRHVVKDVICLPREHYMAQLEGLITPQESALADMGLTARITVDSTWSADQMEGRLALLFHRHFVRNTGQMFSFTYLQKLQGSRMLFVPETPAEGWTGEQVLRISEHGALYIFSHHNYKQAQSGSSQNKSAVLNSKGSQSPMVGQNQPHVCRAPEKLTLNLDTILRLFRLESINGKTETYIKVCREDVLSTALKEVRKPGFCFRSRPVITFSQEEMKTYEEASTEFFRLTLLELQRSCVFEGRPERLFLTYDLTALDDRMYYEAGVLIGWSLAHGGPGPSCLHPALYQLMCCQSPCLEDFNWKDIVDPEAQLRLQELHSCSDVKQLSPGLCDWVTNCGIQGIHWACSNEIPAIYARLVKHYIYHRVASMISQFIEGLNSCGELWDLVKSHWETFLPVMTSKEQKALSLEEFKQLFTFCFSDPDSDLRAAEEATAAHWETVLTMVSDGEAYFSFEDLLLFITGADHLPPLGFPKLISLCFYSQDAGSSAMNLPHASEESLELFLPRGVPEALDLLVLLNRALRRALELRLIHEGETRFS
ncbi:uncharacterized protein LOC119789863 [Cyprinodon tularosa]|uniref:uncharacterized protein LOC119789863 n=1 Tax=Cyprinodon tularosa TaxID=77115 RepID=UPI0018E22146|nr:uncharacterized protein LOC119789863 [Cyprinodon tularosa]